MSDINDLISGFKKLNSDTDSESKNTDNINEDDLQINLNFSDNLLSEALQDSIQLADKGSENAPDPLILDSAFDNIEMPNLFGTPDSELNISSSNLSQDADSTVIPDAGLPMPKMDAGLPSPKAQAGLPMPKMDAGLPSPKAQAGLPMPKMDAGLPSPKTAAGLPSPKVHAGLPEPKTNAEISSPRTATSIFNDEAFGLPGSNEINDLSETRPPMTSASLNRNLFDSVESTYDRAGTKERDRSALNESGMPYRPKTIVLSPKGITDSAMRDAVERNDVQPEDPHLDIPRLKLSQSIQAPLLVSDHAPTGAFNNSHDIDDDSGLPLADDPLGLMPTGHAAEKEPSMRSSQMPDFMNRQSDATPTPGSGINIMPEAASDDGEPANEAPQDDILGLFSMPESEEQPQPVPQGLQPMQAAPLQAHAAPSADGDETKGEVRELTENETEEELVFDIKSIQSDHAKPVAVDVSKSSGKSAKQKKRKKFLIIGSIIAVVLICSAATIANLIYQQRHVTDDELAPIAAPKDISLNWNLVLSDRDAAYMNYYKNAREKLHQDSISPEERAKIQAQLLIDVILGSIHDRDLFIKSFEMLDNSTKELAKSCKSEWCNIGLYAWGVFRQNEELISKFENTLPNTDELKPVIALVRAAAIYYHWEDEKKTSQERIETAESILAALKTEIDYHQWPLAAWLKVSALNKLGRFDESARILSGLRTEDGNPLTPSLALSEIDTLIATDKAGETIHLFEYVEGIKNLSPAEALERSKREIIITAATRNNADFLNALEKYVKAHQDNSELVYAARMACRYTQSYQQCDELFSEMLKVFPKNIELLEAWIEMSIMSQRIDNIISQNDLMLPSAYEPIAKALESGLARDPQRKSFWKLSALLNYTSGKNEEALKAIDEIERGEKFIWFGAYLRQLINYKIGNDTAKEKIRTELEKESVNVWQPFAAIVLASALQFMGSREAAMKVISNAAEISPANSDIVNIQFEFALLNKDLRKAEDYLRKLKRHKAYIPTAEYKLAKLIEELGDPDGALERMMPLIDQVKNDSRFLLYVGQLFFKKKEYKSAIPYLKQSIEADPNVPETYYYRGRCMYESGRYEEALNDFTEAANQNNKIQTYVLWSGLALSKMGQNEDALKSVTTVITAYDAIPADKRTETNTAEAAEAYYYRAKLRRLNNNPESNEDFLKAIELGPQKTEYREDYIVYLYEITKLKKCLAQITALETITDKIDAKIDFIKGVTLLKLNKRNDAITALEAARTKGYGEREESGIIGVREATELYERLGYLYRDVGKKEQARECLTILLEKSKTLSPSARQDIQNDIEKI